MFVNTQKSSNSLDTSPMASQKNLQTSPKGSEIAPQIIVENTQTSRPVSSSSSDSEEAAEPSVSYKTKAYYALPENVRHAIDLSKAKNKNTDFYQ